MKKAEVMLGTEAFVSQGGSELLWITDMLNGWKSAEGLEASIRCRVENLEFWRSQVD